MAVTVDIPGIGEVKADNVLPNPTSSRDIKSFRRQIYAPTRPAGGGAGGGAVGAASGKAAKNVTNLGKASREGASAIGKMALMAVVLLVEYSTQF